LSKPEEALRNYQNAFEIQRRLDEKHDLAMTLNGIAQIQDTMGKIRRRAEKFPGSAAPAPGTGEQAGIGRYPD